ncbi:MAG: IreB family regulatory phosphoprotein [Lachnospiraceae bacterium]|nr:IreB family regulatory phosphoprotein [Lachnospiraceae bacterium]
MNSNTVHFTSPEHSDERIREVLDLVYMALREKGYNPTAQIVGYLMSGDPTYITSHMNARSAIARVERDEIIEVLVKLYISEIERS